MNHLRFWALLLALTASVGCKKHEAIAAGKASTTNSAQAEPDGSSTEAQPPTRGPGSVTATRAPAAIPENADTSVVLNQLSMELRKYVLSSRKAPRTFEEFIAGSRLQAPAAPPGKKYAIEKGAVILVKH